MHTQLIDLLRTPLKGVRPDVAISAIFAAVSFVVVGQLVFDKQGPGSTLVVWGKVLWLMWTLLPPLYFMWDWATCPDDPDSPPAKRMKYNHELCGKFWVAGIGVISAALLGNGVLG